MGTVKFYSKWTIKVSRLIGGGKVDEVLDNVEKFIQNVSVVTSKFDKPELESNRAGLCVTTFVRCQSMQQVEDTIQKFREFGWRT